MSFSLANGVITQTGGSDITRDTPDDILLAGFGVLVAPKTIHLGVNDLTISGFYDDTGWKILYGLGNRFRSTATANWVSGFEVAGKYTAGAVHVLENPSASLNDNNNVYLNGGIIRWFDVTFDHMSTPQSLASRVQFNTIDSTSRIVLRLLGITYLSHSMGVIELLKISLQAPYKTNVNASSMRIGPNFSQPDSLIMIAPELTAGANIYNALGPYTPITINNLSLSVGANTISFFHNRGVDRRFLLTNPLLDLSSIKIYNSGEVVQVDIDSSIALSGDQNEGYLFKAFSGGHYFGAYPLTNAVGESDLKLVDVWNGSGNGTSAYLAPTTIVDRTSVNVNGIKYTGNIITLQTDGLGADGAVKILGVSAVDINITETNIALVNAYTDISTANKLYDIAKSFLVDNYGGEGATIVIRSGNTINAGSYDVVIDATAVPLFVFDGTTITIKSTGFVDSIVCNGTLTLSNGATAYSIDCPTVIFDTTGSYTLNGNITNTVEFINTSGGSVDVIVPVGTLYTNTGPNITVTNPAVSGSFSAPNILDGSRICLKNITQATEIDNVIVVGGAGYSITFSLGAGSPANAGDVLQLTATKQSGFNAWLPLILSGVIQENGTIAFIDNQEPDLIHDNYAVANSIDGSLLDASNGGMITAVFANVQIDVNDLDGVFDSRLSVCWWRYILTTELGIKSYNPNAIAYNPDIRNIEVDGALQIKNVNASALKITEGVWTRKDGGNLIAPTSNTIHWIPDNRVYQGPETGVSGLTAGESTRLNAIPTNPVLADDSRISHLDVSVSSRLADADYIAPDNAGISTSNSKIDNLNDLSIGEMQILVNAIPTDILAAAQATPIHANTKKINDATVQGSGIEADKWRG